LRAQLRAGDTQPQLRVLGAVTAKIVENSCRAVILACMDEWPIFAERNGGKLRAGGQGGERRVQVRPDRIRHRRHAVFRLSPQTSVKFTVGRVVPVS
jgi:hypothetical protein